MSMRCVQYHSGEGLAGRQWAFEPLFFHSPAFVANQFPQGGYLSFTLEMDAVIHAIVHFAKQPEGWVSLSRVPFGGLSCSDFVEEPAMSTLVNFSLEHLGDDSITTFLPFSGYPASGKHYFCSQLKASGFQTAYTDVHQYLNLGSFFSSIHQSQLRRHERARKAGFVFFEERPNQIGEIYHFLEGCRLAQGLKINISYQQLLESIGKFPGSYRAFSIRDGDKVIAACITVHVHSEVLYYYLPGSDQQYRQYSPMVMLLIELCSWASGSGYSIVDLGKSSDRGKKQPGLVTFKQRMGAEEGERKCMVRQASAR